MQNYFASDETRDLITHVLDHVERHKQAVDSESGLGSVWTRNTRFYYAGLLTGDGDSAIDFGGDQGELAKVYSNQARSLTRQFLALVTKARLDFECSARTTESGVLADTRLSNALARHIVDKQRLDLLGDRLAETCALTGSAFLKASWRTDRGRRITKSRGKVVLSGDLEISVHHPAQVVFDTSVEHHHERDWMCLSTVKNRWDLIAQYPALREQILNLPQPDGDSLLYSSENAKSEDLCYVYEFYHAGTPSLPSGKLCVFGDPDAVFFDGDNPYVDQDGVPFIPIVEMKPEPIIGTPWGYGLLNDLIPLQEMLDLSMSTAASNVSAYGLGTMLNPEGNGLTVSDVGGLRFLNYKPTGPAGGGKPEPLMLPSTPGEVYGFGDRLKTHMMELSGINSTLRGAPPSNVTSGTMTATLSANAIEFAAPFAKAYHLALEQALYYSLLIYQRFATMPQVISVVGKNKQAMVREFVGKDLGNLGKVTLKVRSALASTSAGIADAGEKLLKAGLIRSPQEYLELIETGNIETLFETERAELDLINAENDDLREGKVVRAMSTDVHAQHISQHKQVIADPELRRLAARYVQGGVNPPNVEKAFAVMKATQDHVLEHLDLQKSADPLLLAITTTGQAPAPVPQEE